MTLEFFKYHGTGNDFIIIDARNKQINLSESQIKYLCDRRFGIGSDGLMLYMNSNKYQFKMRYFNADGKEGSMCGNGGRCLSAFSHYIGNPFNKMHFEAIDGQHFSEILEIQNEIKLVRLKMLENPIIFEFDTHFEINTGSPHFVCFEPNVDTINVFQLGTKVRHNPKYPEGINVNFVEERGDHIFVRTFERGVEDETLSCGTGVTAAAIAKATKDKLLGELTVKVQTLGGYLEVSFNRTEQGVSNICLTGPATFVYKGQINI